MKYDKAGVFNKRRTPVVVCIFNKGFSRQYRTMMRIAIAGSGGLARIFAYHISQTAHQFIILSRTVRRFVSKQRLMGLTEFLVTTGTDSSGLPGRCCRLR